MALTSPLTLQPYDYIGDSNGRPLDYGQIYIGIADKDPEFNQIPVYLDKAMTKLADQPLRTKGGFIEFAGDLTAAYASASVYSLKVLDKQGRTVFYKAAMMRNNLADDALTSLDAAIADAQAQVAITSAQVVQDAINNVFIGENLTDKTVVTTPTDSGMVSMSLQDLNLNTVNAKRFSDSNILSDTAIKKAIDYAIANNTQVFFDYDVTIKVPTHVSNINDAVHRVSTLHDNKITVLIEAGHQITKGIHVKDSDYSNYIISSVDAEISVSNTYLDAYILKAERAIAPVFNILIDGKGIVDTMIDIQHNSVATVLPYKGVRNPLNRGVYLNGSSRGYMNYLVSTGATVALTGRNLWVSRNSDCECGGANLDGAGDYNLWVSRGSNVYGESMKFKNAGFGAVGATRFSVAACNLATITNCASVARCFAANIYLNDSKATGIKIGGIYTEETGTVSARNIEIAADPSSVSLEYGLKADTGGVISATSAKITGFKLSSAYANSGATISVDSSILTGIGSGIVLDCRDGSTISAKTSTISNAAIAINARGASKVVSTSSNINDITTNAVYALNASTVDISFSNINTIVSNNIAVYRGSNVVVQAVKVAGVAVATSDTNTASFNTWSANGAIFT